jgi:hypothetical protein
MNEFVEWLWESLLYVVLIVFVINLIVGAF